MENNQTIAKYIWYILTLNPYIPMSWGVDVDNLIATDDSLEFHVDGFLFKGQVRITYVEGTDLFQVSLYNEDASLREVVNDIYADSLTDTIDHLVENDGVNYEQQVMNSLVTVA